jgi:predicted carbohydrate-binding protein with CBM5 and CBM33 domain
VTAAYHPAMIPAARISVVLAAPVLVAVLTGVPALAHGAPTTPLSRSAGCQPGGKWAATAACKAVVATSGKLDWDNLRLANVNGKDRQKIPDGKLCSAGLDNFRGLDLPRGDWQTTSFASGSQVTFTYKGTIPHQGTFRWYLTKNGYDPTKQLRWSDLDEAPFLTAKDPSLKSGNYTMTGKLPAGRTGRHLIYTIWQNSSTPDTYYSCADVVLTGGTPPPTATAAATPTASAKASASASAEPVVEASASEPAVADDLPPVKRVGNTKRMALPLVFSGVAVLALAAAALLFILRRRRASP